MYVLKLYLGYITHKINMYFLNINYAYVCRMVIYQIWKLIF
jgi:hypothetical protein